MRSGCSGPCIRNGSGGGAPRSLGLIGVDLPEKAGGLGLASVTAGVIIEEICRADISVGYVQLLGSLMGSIIAANARPEVSQEIVPKICSGEAVVALAANDMAGAAKLLDQAARQMMDGARLAKPEQVAGEKHKRDFEARMESARALLAAQQRITQEKGATKEAQDAARSIERQIGEAQTIAAQGRYEDARPVLDRAYLTARVSIESMRRGDTLGRSLNFASKREEYDYEIDRNDTHAMLIKVLLADRKDAAPAMAPFTDKAAALRSEAEAQAKKGDHAAGIKLLEDSTRELVRAIRSGGIYIPG